jgi:hypothetical protein
MFTDVPDSNPFHDDISAIAGAGITSGKTCDPPGTPPTYCPNEPIVRQAMAAYVHRGFGRIGYDTGTATSIPHSNTEWASLASVPITVGGVPGGTSQVLWIEGVVTFSVTAADSCPCYGTVVLDNDDDPSTSLFANNGRIRLVAPGQSGNAGYATALVEGTWVVPSGSTTTWTLRVHESGSGGGETMNATGELTVMSAPFWADGQVYPSSTSGAAVPSSSPQPTPKVTASDLAAVPKPDR